MEKKFGRIPYYKGEWTTGTVAMHKWRYTYHGSEFQSNIDNNTNPPTDNVGNINSGWSIISRGLDYYLATGYLYKGVANPATDPGSPDAKLIYIASVAGTYTNFLDSNSEPLVLTSGINILSWDGTTWSAVQVVGIDDEPTAGSNNLAKSGGITQVYGKYEDNPEWSYVLVDNNGRILLGIKNDGSVEFYKGLPTSIKDYVENRPERSDELMTVLYLDDIKEYLTAETDSEGRILSARTPDGIKYEEYLKVNHFSLTPVGLNELMQALIEGGFAPSSSGAEQKSIEIAAGKKESYGTYQSELEAMPIANNIEDQYVKYITVGKSNYPKTYGEKIVIVNHDDLPKSDYIANRRIHNKYETLSSFCSVFKPFTSLSEAKEKITNIKKLINDGHEIGLHAMLGFSYWREQRMFDVRPDGSNTFAPNRSEMLGSNPGGTGVNTFGKEVTADTTMANLYFGLNRSFYGTRFTGIKAVDMTDNDVYNANRQYTLYGDEETVQGINDTALEDIMTATSATSVRSTSLQWLERYYNTFIDSNLGYSKYDGTIAERYAEDYSVPENADVVDYYPDAAHLLNGKMVYWNDIENPHYSEALAKTEEGFGNDVYQLVGMFTKGLFKGSFSSCNYEVIDRCVEVAQAFYRKYFNLDRFTDAHTHGVKYLSFYYKNSDDVCFLDRDKKELSCNGKFYVSRIGVFLNERDIFKGFGFVNISTSMRRSYVEHEGLTGFYYGQNGIKNPEINSVGSIQIMEHVDYLTLFGSSDIGMDKMSYANFMTFLHGIDNITKFIYENRETEVTRNGLTYRVYDDLYKTIRCITSTIETGKIPVVSVDTISSDNPAQNYAVDLFCRFCKAMGVEMLSYEAGYKHILSKQRNVEGNLFPNPMFKQSLLEYFGGSSSDSEAYIPDGWYRYSGSASYSVTNQEFIIDGTGTTKCRIYGLPVGIYRMEFAIYTDGSSSTAENPGNRVEIKLVKNKDHLNASTVLHTSHAITGNWVNETIDITIPTPCKDMDDDSPISIMLDGYQDNVACIEVSAKSVAGIIIKNVKLQKI